MARDTWKRTFPHHALVEIVDAVADLIADRVAERIDHRSKPAVERVGLSVEEVAQAIGVAESTVRLRIKDGTIKAGQLGGRTIIHRSELDRLLLGAAS